MKTNAELTQKGVHMTTHQPGQNILKDKVHANGNVSIDLRKGVAERLNIGKIKPCRPPSSGP